MRNPYELMVLTDEFRVPPAQWPDAVDQALTGGATSIQLRAKTLPTRELVSLGTALLERTRARGCPLLVNDRVDVACAIGADGAHIGQDDLPPAAARMLLGPDRILGVSTATVAELTEAIDAGATYLGVGDIFGTPSKPDAGMPVGLAVLRELAGRSPVPVVAIGGIRADNAGACRQAGAAGIAVISAVMGTPDPSVAARQLIRGFRGTNPPNSPVPKSISRTES